MNKLKALGKAAVIGALAFGAESCGSPDPCSVSPRTKEGRLLYSSKEVFDSCQKVNNQIISCLVIPGDDSHAETRETSCNDPNLYTVLTQTFHGDQDAETRLCIDRGGANVQCD